MWEFLVYVCAALGLMLFVVAAGFSAAFAVLWAVSSIPSEEDHALLEAPLPGSGSGS